MIHLIFVLIMMLLGGGGLAASIWFPTHRNMGTDHTVGTVLCGITWLVFCVLVACNVH